MYQKNKPTRCKKYLRGAKDEGCTRCGNNNGTIVGAHYTGIRQHSYGKGTSQKPHDHAVAYLCSECHKHFDASFRYKSVEESEEFLHCIILSQARYLNKHGVIKNDEKQTKSNRVLSTSLYVSCCLWVYTALQHTAGIFLTLACKKNFTK